MHGSLPYWIELDPNLEAIELWTGCIVTALTARQAFPIANAHSMFRGPQCSSRMWQGPSDCIALYPREVIAAFPALAFPPRLLTPSAYAYPPKVGLACASVDAPRIVSTHHPNPPATAPLPSVPARLDLPILRSSDPLTIIRLNTVACIITRV